MRFAFTFVLALALSLLSWGMASRQQEAPATAAQPANAPTQPPPAEQAPAAPPAATAPDTTAPAENKAPENDTNAKPDSTKAASSNATASSAETSSAETKTVVTKRPSRSISAPPAAPRKIVVRRGGAKEPATLIAPGMTPAEAARERQSAEQWLRSTGDQLPQLEVLPDVHQQETVVQIRNYMDGARSALQEGDVRRASTLAEKAHLLAEDLLRR